MIVISALLAFAVGCWEGRERPDRADGGPSTTLAAVDASDVTLTGQVTRSFGNHVIQLGTSPREPVLVVLPTPTAFRPGARLEVSGRIRPFAPADIEAEFGVDLGPEVEGLVGSSCVVAASVRPL